MKSFRALVLLLLLLAVLPAAAQRDSLVRADSVAPRTDSTAFADTAHRDTLIIPPLVIHYRSFDSIMQAGNPYYPHGRAVRLREAVHHAEGKEAIFYAAAGLLLLFAIARNAFARYLQDLFRVFFRATLKQRQAREQLQQSPVPSFYLNFIFVLSAALFLVLLFNHFGLGSGLNFWVLLGYTAAALAALYLGKFIVLRLMGWVFRVHDATDSYLFIIFTANKIIGVLLLPFIVLLAFASGGLGSVALTLSLIVVGAVYSYRYFLSWVTVQRQVRLGLFHFLLYFLAFELAPLLLINKLLFRFLG